MHYCAAVALCAIFFPVVMSMSAYMLLIGRRLSSVLNDNMYLYTSPTPSNGAAEQHHGMSAAVGVPATAWP